MASSARIDELRKKFDENPRRYFAPLANEYRKAGDLEQAIFICQEYLPQQPGHMSGHIVYGQALFELTRYDEARQVFEMALSLDPENLIALRHLGDISRLTGDSRGARSWYQRVLEADPRNEEIGQIMMTLLATPDAPQLAIDPSMPFGTSAPASEAVDEPAGVTDPIGMRPADNTFAVEKSEDQSGLAVGPELSALPERQEPSVTPPQPQAAAFTSREQIPDSELLDLNDFSIGGIPMAELGTPVSLEAVAPTQPFPDEAQAADETRADEEEVFEEEVFTESVSAFIAETMPASAEPAQAEHAREETVSEAPSVDDESELAIEKSTSPFDEFEADPFAIAAAPTQPEEELASDITLGLPDDGMNQAPAAPEAATMPGLESFDHGIAAPPVETPTLEFESFFATPVAEIPPADEGVPALDEMAAEMETPSSSTFETTPAAMEVFEETAWSAPVNEAAPEPEQEPALEPEPAPILSWSLPEPDPLPEPAMEPEPITSWTTPLPDLEPEPVAEPEPIASWSPLPDLEPELEPEPEPELQTEPEPIAAWESPIPPAAEPEPVAAWAMLVEPTPEPEVVEAAPTSDAFVTETMADLYLQQGHTEAALEIYQRLVAQRPHDAVLRDRLRLIEDQVRGYSVPAEVESLDEPVFAPPAVTGPTIRDFLNEIVRTLPAAMTAIPTPPATTDFIEHFGSASAEPMYQAPALDDVLDEPVSAVAPMDDVLADAVLGDEPVAEYDLPVAAIEPLPSIESEFGDEPEAPPAVEKTLPTPAFGVEIRTIPRGTPAIPGETVSGSIDALFSGADSSSTDANAADTLAQAFAPEGPETKPLEGMPAHKASSELSLDRVFKTTQPSRPESEGEGFSFDQFFANDVSDEAGKAGADTGSSAGQGADDIAQFNNWLNGLKKT